MNVKLKAILPDKGQLINPAILERNVAAGLNDVAEKVQQDFWKTVSSWKSKDQPKLAITSPSLYSRLVTATGKVYGMVNEGTPPHEIIATRRLFLRFNFPTLAKTVPGVIGSGPGAVGPNVGFAQSVHHPGFEGREFDLAIAEKWNKKFAEEMEKWVDRAIKEAGF